MDVRGSRGGAEQRRAVRLAAVLVGAATAHFVRPEWFDRLIPPVLPGSARAWTYGSGVVELATAALVAHPRSRRTGGLLAAAVFVGVLPGNIKMAVDACKRPGTSRAYRIGTVVRVPLQLPLVRWALRVRRGAER